MPSAREYANGYAIWALFGLLGWHHLYFGRYLDAIAFGQSLGVFGIGWLLDVFSIHKYVQERARSMCSGEPGIEADAPRPPAEVCRQTADFIYSAFSVAAFACLYGAMAELAWTSVVAVRDVEGVGPRAAAYAIVSASATTGGYFAARWRSWDVNYLAVFLSAFTWVVVAETRGATSSLVLVAAFTAPMWAPTRLRALDALPLSSASLWAATLYHEFILSNEKQRSDDDPVAHQVPVAFIAALGTALGAIFQFSEHAATSTAHPPASVSGPLTVLSPAPLNSPASIDAPRTTSTAPPMSETALVNAWESESDAACMHVAPSTAATEPSRVADTAREIDPSCATDTTHVVAPTHLLQAAGDGNPIVAARSTNAATPGSTAATSGPPAAVCALESPPAPMQRHRARMHNQWSCKYFQTGGQVVGSLMLQAAWLLLAIFIFFLHVEVSLDLSGEFNESGRYRLKLGRLLWAHRYGLYGRLTGSVGSSEPQYLHWPGLESYEHFQAEKWQGTSDYATLGLLDGAPLTDVKSAHRSLVRQVHPDRLPHDATARQRAGATTHFRMIQAAYDRLSRKASDHRDARDADRVRSEPSRSNRRR